MSVEVAGSALQAAAMGQFAVSFLPLGLLFRAQESWLFYCVFLPCDDCDRGFVHKDERKVE